MVDHDKVLMNAGLQMRDRLVQPHAVEAGFLRVGEKSLEILERAGHFGLAVALDHRHVDQEVDLVHVVDDVQLHTGAVHFVPPLLLSVHEGNIILLTQLLIAAIFIGVRCPVTHPGALNDRNVLEPILLQIFDDARHHLGVRRAAELGRRGDYQVRLDGDPGLSVSDEVRQLCLDEQFLGHILKRRSVNFPDLIFTDQLISFLLPDLSFSLIFLFPGQSTLLIHRFISISPLIPGT